MNKEKVRDVLKRLKLIDGYGITNLSMCLIAVAFILLSALALHLAWEHDSKACEAAGGTLSSDVSTGYGTGTSSKGETVSGSVTTVDVECVMPNG